MKTNLRFIGKSLSAYFKKLAKELPDQVTEELQAVGEDMQKDFEKTTATWNNPPTFGVEQTPNRYVRVTTDSAIYRYLDLGTRVRYATMSPDFVSKTKPDWISSRAGRGRVLFINRNHPRPGILARNFTVIIVKRRQPHVVTRVRGRLHRGLEAAGT